MPIKVPVVAGVFLLSALAVVCRAGQGAGTPASVDAPAAFSVSGVIDRDTVWSGTVSVVGSVQVLSGVTLNIRPGTRVQFALPPPKADSGEERLYVQKGATLIARGTDAQPIVFLSATPGVRWFGIELHSGHDRDVFDRCRVRDSRMGIACVSTSPVIQNCVFEENQQGVSLWRQANPIVRNGSFLRNAAAVVVSMQSAPTIAHCEIEGSEEVGIRIDAGCGGSVEETRLRGNKVGIQRRGSAPFRVAGNRFDANAVALSIDHEGSVAEVRGNTFSGNQQGVLVATKASVQIAGNTFFANGVAIHFDGRSKGIAEHNDFRGNRIGIRLSRTSSPEITGNEFSKNETAVLCETSSYPVLADNNFRGNATAVRAGDHQSFEWTRSIWKREEWEGWAESYGANRIVARDNYWGEETTREMEAGATPIGAIFDVHQSRDVVVDGKPYRRDEVDFRPFQSAPIAAAGAPRLPTPRTE
ncbi:MAG: right-handed parallel beta-helix repeat-containing protein [Deltaproteobacteria bacterium]|nr:right-handed parallel beta-helix repeat-containing protein [Deltaproteobacteria bacterium]